MNLKKTLLFVLRGIDWRLINIEDRITSAPPPSSAIPSDLMPVYTQNGAIPVLYWYLNGTIGNNQTLHITKKQYKKVFRKLQNRTFRYYRNEGSNGAMSSFYKAFEKYSLKDKTVLIWGLAEKSNCEAMALWQGASHVYVVDYNLPICEHEKVTVLNHEQLMKSGIQTDVAISFSSFEHDGLGRYGDPLNPNGDIEAMQNARKYLKDDGFLLLGVPEGKDCLVWNAHRVYGEIRLPLLLQGWDVLDTFLPDPLTEDSIKEQKLGFFSCHPLHVLRKSALPSD